MDFLGQRNQHRKSSLVVLGYPSRQGIPRGFAGSVSDQAAKNAPKIHRPGFFVFDRARIAVGDSAGFFAAISLIDVERLVEFRR